MFRKAFGAFSSTSSSTSDPASILAGYGKSDSSSAAVAARSESAKVQTVFRSELVHDISSVRELEEFEDGTLLGQGSYGSVHLIPNKNYGGYRVLKSVVRPESWNRDRLQMEGLIMKNLDHPHVLRLFEWFENGDLAKLVCEFCAGGELLATIRKGRGNGVTMEEPWAACALRQSFQALAYIHSKNIVHKDLKGENLLLLRSTVGDSGRDFGKPPHVVICDFGTAEIYGGGGMAKVFSSRGTRVAGTPATMAPEVMTGNCSPKSDTWSMGCVMFEMLTNQMPFNLSGSMADAAKKQVLWLELHKQGPKWEQMRSSSHAKNLCQKMLSFRESSRPSALECLRQPWLAAGYDLELSHPEKSWLRKSVMEWFKRSPCRQAMCTKMAATCNVVDRFSQAYLKIDRDINGQLEKNEVLGAMLMCGYDKDTARKLTEDLDVNGDGTIHFLEFSAMCLPSLDEEFDELLAQEFRAIAKTRGFITQIEMAPLFQELRQIDKFDTKFADLDLNKDGKVDFKEFCSYFGRPGVDYGGEEEAKAEKEEPAPRQPATSASPKAAAKEAGKSVPATPKGAAKKAAKAKARKPSKEGATADAVEATTPKRDEVKVKAAPVKKGEEPAEESGEKREEITMEMEDVTHVPMEISDLLDFPRDDLFPTPAKRVEQVTVSL